MIKKFFTFVFLLSGLHLFAEQIDSTIRVLIITAHPDDEAACAATVYKITHEQKGVVDLAVITNGEGGYKYSLLAEPYYNIKLTDEATGRKYLPTIRKKELMAAGNIIGISNFYFLDQLDNHYTLDPDTVLNQVWDVSLIKKRISEIIDKGKYDFIFCLLPTEDTHGHHKAAAILALQIVSELKLNKPLILGMTNSRKVDTTATIFHGLKKYPQTSIADSGYSYTVDRTTPFGFKNQLNYQIIVSWEIAEHKSQGTVHSYANRGDHENFWYFDANGNNGREKAKKMFERLNGFIYK